MRHAELQPQPGQLVVHFGKIGLPLQRLFVAGGGLGVAGEIGEEIAEVDRYFHQVRPQRQGYQIRPLRLPRPAIGHESDAEIGEDEGVARIGEGRLTHEADRAAGAALPQRHDAAEMQRFGVTGVGGDESVAEGGGPFEVADLQRGGHLREGDTIGGIVGRRR